MAQEKEVKISYWAAHLTTVISVTMVLILAGVIAFVTISAEKETKRLKERLEVDIIMGDNVNDTVAQNTAREVTLMPFAQNVNFISKEEALKQWKNDTGEDLEELFGINPLSPEISFNIKSEYAADSLLNKIEKELSVLPGVEEVVLPDSAMVKNMNSNIEALAIVLGVIALAMVIISFVLINNTVHLSIYARRFTIHTMQLVGATNNFIRTPLVSGNMLAGLIAGLLASAILAICIIAAPGAGFGSITTHISWPLYACVAGGMLITGALLCGLAAWIAATRYLAKDYEDLFK